MAHLQELKLNFLIDPKLRQVLIDQLDYDGQHELAVALEHLPVITSYTDTIYQEFKRNQKRIAKEEGIYLSQRAEYLLFNHYQIANDETKEYIKRLFKEEA